MTTRRLFLLGLPLLIAGLAAGRSEAQQISLAEISRYFNEELVTAEGEFTQINPDGTISTGTIYIKRPGRVRFEYNPPEESIVMAAGGSLAIFDPRSNTRPERYPLSETPLSIILARNVDLTRARMVTNHTSDGTTTTVTAQDPDHPEYGNIRLIFTGNPTELRQWVITDDLGEQTTVILGDLKKGGRIPESRFNILAELRRRGFDSFADD